MSDIEKVVLLKRRIYRIVPFGYTRDPIKRNIANPDPHVYKYILEARKMRANGSSFKECGTYLSVNLNLPPMFEMNVKRILERDF